MPQRNKERVQGRLDRAWPLYGAAFCTAVSLATAWTAMPFVLIAIGGTKVHVGYAPALNSLTYMAALLLAGWLLGHLDVKRATRFATVAAIFSVVLMVVAVGGATLFDSIPRRVWVWLTILAGGLGGGAMALYWPFLMSWVSGTYEGLALNRRFGRYNGSWSGGALIGPLIGARLVEIAPIWPMVASVTAMVTSLGLLSLARNGVGGVDAPTEADSPPEPACDAGLLTDFRWLSRITMFCAWACFAIARSQFALLFTGLGHSESQFGVYLALLALCNFLALIASGRWAFWHFRAYLLIGAQCMILAATLMIIYGTTLFVFLFSGVILGLAFGFAYSSHLFYGASASRNRSTRMAIHEMVISVGITVGAGAGGYLAEHVGLYAPYWFVVGLVTLGMFFQVMIHAVARIQVVTIMPSHGPVSETE